MGFANGAVAVEEIAEILAKPGHGLSLLQEVTGLMAIGPVIASMHESQILVAFVYGHLLLIGHGSPS